MVTLVFHYSNLCCWEITRMHKHTTHTHTPTQIFYLSHLVSTFGLWFLWPSVAEVLDNVNQRLVLICVQCIARGTCPINEDSAVGQCTYLKWKWAQLPPLFTNSRRCNGKSPTNFSMWINSKWINIYIYIFENKAFVMFQWFERGCKRVLKCVLSINLSSVETLKAFDKHSYQEVRCLIWSSQTEHKAKA